MTEPVCVGCNQQLNGNIEYCNACSILMENRALKEQLKYTESSVRDQTIQKIAEFIKNNHKNNIYWKWASNDIVDALSSIKW